jgi:hypothetical protein
LVTLAEFTHLVEASSMFCYSAREMFAVDVFTKHILWHEEVYVLQIRYETLLTGMETYRLNCISR